MGKNTWMLICGLAVVVWSYHCRNSNPASLDEETQVVQSAPDSAQIVTAPRIPVDLSTAIVTDFRTPWVLHQNVSNIMNKGNTKKTLGARRLLK